MCWMTTPYVTLGCLPISPREYINDIKEAIQDGFSVASMSAKEWYTYLLNKYILEEKTEDDPAVWTPKATRAEIQYPMVDWQYSWQLARIQGISNECRSFLFRMLHQLLPTRSRLHRLSPRTNPSPLCVLWRMTKWKMTCIMPSYNVSIHLQLWSG